MMYLSQVGLLYFINSSGSNTIAILESLLLKDKF